MKLTLSTILGDIQIELLNNLFTKKWLDHFQFMTDAYTSRILLHPYPGVVPAEYLNSELKISRESDIENLQSAVDILHSLNIGFPYNIDQNELRVGSDAGQQQLNRLHRAFTNSFRTLSQGLPLSWYSDGREPFTVSAESFKLFQDNSANVNTYVHNLEKFMMTENKQATLSTKTERASIYFDAYGASDDSKILERRAAQDLTIDDDEYFDDSEEYDVWVGKDILGKDYMTGFLENDDPREWDISQLQCFTGRIEIDITPHTFIQRIKSAEFQNWLRKHDLEYDPRMAGIPLGRLLQGKEILRELIQLNPEPLITGIDIQ